MSNQSTQITNEHMNISNQSGQDSHRSKNSSSHKTQNFDYSECQFQTSVYKKGIFSKTNYYLYAKHGFLIICTKPYDKKPHKIIPIQNNWKAKFIEDEKKKNKKDLKFIDKVIGFKLMESFIKDKDKLSIEYYGQGFAMVQIRDFFCKELFLTDFYNEYEILEKLGQGKYAKVYRIKSKDTGEYFAVKYMYKKKLKQQDVGEEALLNELTILQKLDHPNVLKHIATYEDENGYYIITELLDGDHCLHKEIKRFKETKFDYEVAKIIMQQLLKGLQYIHSLKIMHRDLKPQNIMFANHKQIPGVPPEKTFANHNSLKIIDFGLAQFYEEKKYIYVHVGTPGYVAPEILADERDTHTYNEKVDIFSVGIILHLLLTGRQVFEGTKFKEVLDKNRKCNFQFQGSNYENINYNAINLLVKMLEADPKKRISAKDALEHPFFKQGEHINRRRKASIDLKQDKEKDNSSDLEDYFDENKTPNQIQKNQQQQQLLQTDEKEIMLNRNRASSFKTSRRRSYRQQGHNNDENRKQQIQQMKSDVIQITQRINQSPLKTPHKKSIFSQDQVKQDGQEEIDYLPSPTKQNLGKDRKQILNMVLELFNYMINMRIQNRERNDSNKSNNNRNKIDMDSSLMENYQQMGLSSLRDLRVGSTENVNQSYSVRVENSSKDIFKEKSKFSVSSQELKKQNLNNSQNNSQYTNSNTKDIQSDTQNENSYITSDQKQNNSLQDSNNNSKQDQSKQQNKNYGIDIDVPQNHRERQLNTDVINTPPKINQYLENNVLQNEMIQEVEELSSCTKSHTNDMLSTQQDYIKNDNSIHTNQQKLQQSQTKDIKLFNSSEKLNISLKKHKSESIIPEFQDNKTHKKSLDTDNSNQDDIFQRLKKQQQSSRLQQQLDQIDYDKEIEIHQQQIQSENKLRQNEILEEEEIIEQNHSINITEQVLYTEILETQNNELTNSQSPQKKSLQNINASRPISQIQQELYEEINEEIENQQQKQVKSDQSDLQLSNKKEQCDSKDSNNQSNQNSNKGVENSNQQQSKDSDKENNQNSDSNSSSEEEEEEEEVKLQESDIIIKRKLKIPDIQTDMPRLTIIKIQESQQQEKQNQIQIEQQQQQQQNKQNTLQVPHLNPFENNILNPKIIALLNFFPQQIFAEEMFQEQMEVLGKFMLFGIEWQGQSINHINKKIQFLERKVIYKKWVFDFLKNVFKLRNEKNADYVEYIEISLENCHQLFKNNLETKKLGGLLGRIA